MGFYFLANKGFVKIVNQYDLGEYNFVRCWLQVQDHFLKTCHGHNNTHLTIYDGRKLCECNCLCGVANTRILLVWYPIMVRQDFLFLMGFVVCNSRKGLYMRHA